MVRPADWVRQKSDLNHRILHNQHILALRAAEQDLASGRLTEDLEVELRRQVLPRWPSLRSQIERAASQCEAAMSPELAFDNPPLSGLPPAEKRWLRQLTVGLWKSRHPVDEILGHLSAAIARVEVLHATLSEEWAVMNNPDRVTGLRELGDACVEVSRLLSSLPSGYRGI